MKYMQLLLRDVNKNHVLGMTHWEHTGRVTYNQRTKTMYFTFDLI